MNKICKLFNIKYPIVQGGMVWCSGWKLASAVSNQGGLGLLGAGSMHPETFREHVQKMQSATDKPWGVNLPLLYPELDKIIDIIIKEKVKIVFTSAGSPKKWTQTLKSHGITVVHVVSSSLFAKKCEDAGVDAIVAEGFEAGGHNGREETTTLTLIPQVRRSTSLPVIAAGGIGSGQAWLAAHSLGADGVQIGSLFAVSKESSAHSNFKETVFKAKEGDTKLSLKSLAPVRLLNNHFYQTVQGMERAGATPESLREILGKGRAKQGMFLGELEEGELEIGQVSSMIEKEKSVSDIFTMLLSEYNEARDKIVNEEQYRF
ncbi:NAD(P)H-dependent flavin oxidoreductase [Halosquirtibacter laminarini]|uniref:NAD(P)H-dependent flavin oxidoreductase n=1 Tax=Halosquirtibacter laminarini TaxID=3374600 RepID=UPI00374A05B3